MRPDAIPVRPLASRAILSPADARVLFGTDTLSGRETAEVIRLGTLLATIPVTPGVETRIIADSLLETPGSLRLSGPLGAVPVPISWVRTRLLVPSALRRAWGLDVSASVVMGAVGLTVDVEDGELTLEVDRALWIGAGQPQTARWIAGLVLPGTVPETDAPKDDGTVEILRRVVTETDVRQAVLRRKQIRLREGQIVTPAAQAMAREQGVFAA